LQVERSEYEKLDRIEDRMWWFAGLHKNLLMLSQRVPFVGTDLSFLDAGCGTGGLLARLATIYPDRGLLGLDLDPGACRRASIKSARPVCAGSVNDLPFADGAFAVITSADVLCHEGVDERRALGQFHRCLAEGGWLILNLPAYRWMLSRHDTAVSNVRRYTARGLSRLLRSVGFRPVYISYWNAILFPLMVMTRKILPDNRETDSDVRLYPRPVDWLCRAGTAIETKLLRAGMRFPFGGSILALAAKEGAAHG
jgi:SAM-dependent methyltransferase